MNSQTKLKGVDSKFSLLDMLVLFNKLLLRIELNRHGHAYPTPPDSFGDLIEGI